MNNLILTKTDRSDIWIGSDKTTYIIRASNRQQDKIKYYLAKIINNEQVYISALFITADPNIFGFDIKDNRDLKIFYKLHFLDSATIRIEKR